MALFFRTRRDGTRVWGVDYYDPDTRRRVKKRIGSKKRAQRELRLILGAIEDKGTLTGLLAARSPRLGEWAAIYLDHLCADNAPHTLEQKHSQLALMADYFDGRGIRLSGLTDLQISAYVRWRLDRGHRLYPGRPIAARTVNMELQLLRDVWNRAKHDGKVRGDNPITGRVMLAEDPRAPVILTESQFQAVLAACADQDARQRRPGAGLRDLLLFIRYTGCRWASEALPLRLEDVSPGLGQLVFVRPKLAGRRARHRKPRILPLVAHLAELLDRLEPIIIAASAPAPSGACYFGGPAERNRFRMAWERARAAAGFPDLCLHHFRHMASSHMQRLGVDPLSLEAVLGHKLPGMLGHYGHATLDGLARALLALAQPFPDRTDTSIHLAQENLP
jgi:integrase